MGLKLDIRKQTLNRRTLYADLYEKNKVQSHVVIYESYMGRGMICNPYAIFLAFMQRLDFFKFDHYWSLEDLEDEDSSFIIKKYEKYSNVHFIKRDSVEYLEILTKAKYLINNVVFPDYFTKKKSQIYVNTWHGIPLKTLGYDLPGGSIEVRNTVRNFLATDYIISPNKYMTECYKKNFRLDGIYQGEILEEGQPRNDIYGWVKEEEVRNKLVSHGVKMEDGKKIILYAPTWKGNDYGNPDISIETYLNFIAQVENKIDTRMYQVLVKPHQVVYKHIKDNNEFTNQFVPATIDTNELLSVVDILVSDYSSIFFDFLVTGKPVLFYIPDLEEYALYRGLYGNIENLPGPSTKDIGEIGAWICNIENIQEKYRNIYKEKSQWACKKDDGHVSERVLDFMFHKSRKYQVTADCVTKKKKILIYAGELSQNGITHSIYSLLRMIDDSKFDVSVLAVLHNKNENAIYQIDEKARVLVQTSMCNATLEETEKFQNQLEQGEIGNFKDRWKLKKMFQREYRRLYGDTKFDVVIDFNGYSPWYGALFSYVSGARKIIWQHNDLKREENRKINGEEALKKRMQFVFSLYPYFDQIVGCSHSVMEINKKNVGTRWTRRKFTFARNTLNLHRIQDALTQDNIVRLDEVDYYVKRKNEEFGGGKMNVDLLELPKEDEITYVAMGRLSPEKNYENLIKAFAMLQKTEIKTKLFIIGDGILRESIAKEIHNFGLDGKVILTGNLENPFGLMKYADCFVLASNYEGQPLVIQEARVLGLPIIMSDFTTGQDVYQKNGQLVVKKDEKSLYKGLKAFLDGKVPEYKFDGDSYNQEVYEEFERLFEE